MIARPAPSPSHRRLAYLLAALSAVGPFCIDAYLPSMPEISRVFGVPLTAVQQTLTAYMATFALMTLWHGALSDAYGRRRVILGTTALFCLASIGCALSTSLPMLLVFRALQGMTAGAGMVVGRAMVRDLSHGAEAQRMMSLVSLTFAFAPAIAPVVGGWLQHWYGWRAAFLFMAAFSACVGLWAWWALPESLPRERRQPFRPGYLVRSYGAAVSSPPFLAATLALGFAFGGFFIYVLSAPVFLMRHLKLAETEFLWMFGPFTLGMMGGAWLSGRLAGRLTPPRTVLVGGAVMALATAGNIALNLAAPAGLPWSVAPLFLYVLGLALAMPSLTLMALDLFPAKRGLAASCQSFIQSATNSLVAAFVAPLAWASPLGLALGEAVLFSLAGVALAVHLWLAPAEEPPEKVTVEGEAEA